MAALSTAPWTEPVVNIDPAKIVVIYAPAVSWAQEACEYYCDQRGIPRANLLALTLTITATGNGCPSWVATSAEFLAACGTVAEKLNAVSAAGVVFGPGFPTVLTMQRYSGGVLDVGVNASTDMCWSLAASRYILATVVSGQDVGVETSTGPARLVRVPSGGGSGTQSILYAGFSSNSNLGEYIEFLTGGSAAALYPHPTQAQMQTAFDGRRGVVAYGILGWPIPTIGRLTTQTAESLATVKALIDRVTAAMLANTTNTAKRALPTLYSLIDVGGGNSSMPDHKWYCNKLIEWGLNVSYYYPYAATDGGTAPLVAGQWHTPTELAAGVTPLQYFMRIGATINDQDTAGGTYDSNQSPLAGGTCMISGESYGTRANHHALANQSGCAGTVETQHITGAYSIYQLGKHSMLLRGLSVLEACAWTSYESAPAQVPCGDPLYAPYGSKRFRMLGTLTDAPEATDPGGLTLTHGSTFELTSDFAGFELGTRANAPAYTKSFDGLTTGLICTDPSIGLTSQGDTADGLYAYVSTVRSRKTGGKSLRLVHPAIAGPEVPDSFPQLGISGLSLTRVYVSTWFYWERISGTGGSGTFKLCRGGGDPPYGGVPRFHETYNGIDPTTGVATSYDPDRGASNTSNVTAYSNAVNASPSRDGWHRLEYYFYPGTEGNSDGIYKTWVDGVLNGNLVNIPLVLSGHGAAPVENVITPFDGMDSYSNDTSFACYIDDFHVDSTLRRLELGNASTWGACTVREFQPSTAWSGTSVTATCERGAISGSQAWLYVLDDSGTASAGIPVTLA